MASGNKNVFFILNGLVLATGIALVVFGFMAKSTASELEENYKADILSHEAFEMYSYTRYIVFGLIVSIFALAGIYAAFTEHRSLLIIHAIILLISMLVLFTWMLCTFYWGAPLPEKKTLSENLQKAFEKTTGNATNDEIATVQNHAQCCGFNGSSDYNKDEIPASCCKSEDLVGGKCDVAKAHKSGCSSTYVENLISGFEAIRLKYIFIGVFELIGLICACGLTYVTRNSRDQGFGI